MAAKRKLERTEFDAVTRQLVSRAQAGRWAAPVPADAAEDVVQEVWLRLLRAPSGIPQGTKLRAHANATLRDAIADYWRSRTRKKDVPVTKLVSMEGAAALRDPVLTPSRALAALEAQRVRAALVEIVGPDAAAYAVLDALELTQAQIAEQLGISLAEADRLRKCVSRKRCEIAAAIGKRQPGETEAT